ncbi:exopolysaccharide biosynthesis polyprenyl glycosylphosphotransferase [Halomonas sp. DP4Y7-1]|nr:exopolysaccharide biosynthesis polyprenyl glycosylphosphotransferase [Halomonas sp. DP4Y7-2]MBY6232763.1 exopolysaccharide biosynthesis polyprenyl glycosylphosphotransferase [Halomonas sp. DP4Y7-1]
MRYDAIVADLRSDCLGPEWERFLAECTLCRIPVYHVRQIQESMSGKVRIDHLSENEFGSLMPSAFYSSVKRLVDIFGVFVLLPIVTPIMLVTAFLIRRESEGPALFLQERMGYRGKSFKVYKFRSMYVGKKGKGFTAGEDDPRITKVGRIIRKYRVDELPQLFNVIKGEMSFIGPRPESMELSEWYERDVPFFRYRHVVRPGISGWAQVEQGYAAEVEGMIEKLQYDFYYIKHFSLWLDVLVLFKTVKTIVTGNGAR